MSGIGCRSSRPRDVAGLLVAAGAYRADCTVTLGGEVAQLAQQVAADPFFICFPSEVLEGGAKEDDFGESPRARESSCQPARRTLCFHAAFHSVAPPSKLS